MSEEHYPDPATLDVLLGEHVPPELVVRWVYEELDARGLGRPRLEDIPPEVHFRVQQRMILRAAERATEPLRTELRAAYEYNEERGELETG